MKLTTQELTDRMREMILRGEFASGEHMRETALAEQFQVPWADRAGSTQLSARSSQRRRSSAAR